MCIEAGKIFFFRCYCYAYDTFSFPKVYISFESKRFRARVLWCFFLSDVVHREKFWTNKFQIIEFFSKVFKCSAKVKSFFNFCIFHDQTMKQLIKILSLCSVYSKFNIFKRNWGRLSFLLNRKSIEFWYCEWPKKKNIFAKILKYWN